MPKHASNNDTGDLRVGDLVAVGEFETQRELKVFDFTAFTRIGTDRSKAWGHTRYDFITEMEDQISKPISPFAQQREYIPTQIVAEYLREHFDSDAVIYKSPLNRNETNDNRNIVIFNRTVDFVGDSKLNPLSYRSYDIKTVNDVSYKITSHMQF